ncbi:hypothetical protein HYDPIDRAFT_91891, partial [Hydnomerulius pinastri MD-312]
MKERERTTYRPYSKNLPVKRTESKGLAPSEEARTLMLRQSEISAITNPKEVISKILSTPVHITASEILGVSCELSGILADQIKLKSQKDKIANPSHAQSHHVKSRMHTGLIRLPVRSHGHTISAITDTRSEIDIVSQVIWKCYIQDPMD